MSQSNRDLLVRGIAAAKAGDKQEARFFLEWLLRLDPPLEEKMDAWYWMSEVSTDIKEQRNYVEEILANNLGDARARRRLAIIDGEIRTDEIIDPDRISRKNIYTVQEATAHRFTCPQCGGRMTYTADGQSLTCEYCATRHQIDDGKEADKDNFIAAMATAKGHLHPVSRLAFNCQGCGVDFILPPDRMTLVCPYCNSSYVVQQDEKREILEPDAIIPFAVNELKAKQALKSWILAQEFEHPPRVTRGQGIYIPGWLFNMGGLLSWNSTVNVDGKWVPQKSQKTVEQNNILEIASKKIPRDLIPLIYSYDLGSIVDYDERYLATWIAENYQVPLGEASLVARKKALEKERKAIEKSSMLPIRDLTLNSTNMIVDTFQLVLLPVWISSYILKEDKDKAYPLLINGQNRQVFAQTPKKGLMDQIEDMLGL